MANLFKSVLSAAAALLQSKTVTAGTSNITVSPDDGYDGLSSVTVQPTPSTAITPSNSSPATLSSDSIYKMSGAGYAIQSYSAITPYTTPQMLLSGQIVKLASTGYLLKEYTFITPDNSSPPTIASDGVYRSGGSGYAIQSYTNVTPSSSASSGTAFDAGFVKMSQSGRAYTGNVTATMSETALWTNSSPATATGAMTITLSQSMANFDYLKCIARLHKDVDLDVILILPVSHFQASTANSVASSQSPQWFGRDKSKARIIRSFYYVSNTSIQVNAGSYWANGSSTINASNNVCIPKQIIGMKLSTRIPAIGF